MATIPYVQAQQVAKASEQNALITQVNTNTNAIESNTAAIGSAGGTLSNLQSRLTTLENKPAGNTVGTYFGQWTDASNGSGTIINKKVDNDNADKGLKVTDITAASGTPVGCSMSAGTFTTPNAGLWQFNFSVQYQPSTAVRAIFLCLGTASVFSGGSRLGLLGGPSMDAQSSSCVVRLTANQQMSIYSACWTLNGTVTVWRALGNNFTATWLGP